MKKILMTLATAFVAVSMNVWDDTEGDYVATDVNYNVYTTNDKITCSNFKYTFEF